MSENGINSNRKRKFIALNYGGYKVKDYGSQSRVESNSCFSPIGKH